MQRFGRRLLSALFVLACTLSPIAASADPIRIALVGDSTVETYDQSVIPGCWGWGQALSEYLDDGVVVTNHAKSGRSSKSFYLEGRWSAALATDPDYVLIQFGHNDLIDKGSALATLTTPVPSTLPPSPTLGWRLEDYYRHNMETYVNQARAAGVKPIIVMPMERRNYRIDGTIVESNRLHALAAQEVGDAMGVPVINLNSFCLQTYQSLGPPGTYRFHYVDPVTYFIDPTHFSPIGARLYAAEVAQKLSLIPDLSTHVIPEPACVAAAALPLFIRRRR